MEIAERLLGFFYAMTKVKIGAAQIGTCLFDAAATFAKFETYLEQAAEAELDLLVFPEAFIGGYPKGIDFGVTVGARSHEGREQFRQYAADAVERGSPELARIESAIKACGVNIILGLIERDGGTLYCVTAGFDRSGAILSWHRKLMPTAMERVIWGQGAGDDMDIAAMEFGGVSSAICWENYMPLYRAHLYSQGPVVHTAPTVDDRDVWLPTLQMIALEGRCFVVSACQYMTRGHAAAKWYNPVQGTAAETVLIRGGSCIISPMGEVLSAPVFNKETLISAEIDLDDIPRAQFDLDNRGHYTRPDVFSLMTP
jgi:nitrilase